MKYIVVLTLVILLVSENDCNSLSASILMINKIKNNIDFSLKLPNKDIVQIGLSFRLLHHHTENKTVSVITSRTPLPLWKIFSNWHANQYTNMFG